MAVTKAYVLDDGSVVKESILNKYAIKQSNQIPSDRFGENYSQMGLMEPLYNPEALAQLLEINVYHYRCCKTKARDTAGLGWILQPAEGVKELSDEQWDRAMAFLENPHPDMTLTQINDQVMVDYEATGNGYYEVIRNSEGLIVGLEHIPAHTVRVHESMEKYAQIRGTKKVWFKKFGVEKDLDYETGKFGENIPDERKATEIIHIRNYTSRSDFYGVPDILPALGTLLADRERQAYNISFFENYGVPAYVVTIVGAELDEEVENKIKRYFQNEIKEKRHSTLVITANKAEGDYSETPIEIKFQALSTEVKEASFRMFRQDNRDEILVAHGVPPYRAGVTVVGNLGGTTAAESTEIYKQSVIEPRQEMLENVINRYILRQGLEITDWKFKLKDIDTRDVDKEIDRLIRLFNIGVYSPNDILDKLGEEPIEDDLYMNMHYINGRPLGTTEMDSRMYDEVTRSLKQFHEKIVEIATKRENGNV